MSQAGETGTGNRFAANGGALATFFSVLLALIVGAGAYWATALAVYSVQFALWRDSVNSETSFWTLLIVALLLHHGVTLRVAAWATRPRKNVRIVLAIVSVSMLALLYPLLMALSAAASCSGDPYIPFSGQCWVD